MKYWPRWIPMLGTYYMTFLAIQCHRNNEPIPFKNNTNKRLWCLYQLASIVIILKLYTYA